MQNLDSDFHQGMTKAHMTLWIADNRCHLLVKLTKKTNWVSYDTIVVVKEQVMCHLFLKKNSVFTLCHFKFLNKVVAAMVSIVVVRSTFIIQSMSIVTTVCILIKVRCSKYNIII